MSKSIQKIIGLLSVTLSLLIAASSIGLAQQPAPRPSLPAAQSPSSTDVHARVTETLIDKAIPDDPPVDQMLSVYSPKVRALDTVIGALKGGELAKGGIGAGSLGNFVVDALRARASLARGNPVDLAVMNGGGLRQRSIAEGEIRVSDIFDLLPFENMLVTVDLTGEQLLKLLEVVVGSRDAQSGARITYLTKADRSSHVEKAFLVDATGGEKPIDPAGSYTIATIDYLYNVGGRYSVLREGKSMKPLGITLRDAVIDYVKAQTASKHDLKPNLDGRFVFDKANSEIIEERRPQ